MALLRRPPAFLDDLVQRHRSGVEDARTGWAILEQLLGHQRARVEANGAATYQLAATHGDEIDSPGSCTNEVNRHLPSPLATAQVARTPTMRSPSRRALRPAAAKAEASAIDGTPLASSEWLDVVMTRSATPARSLAG